MSNAIRFANGNRIQNGQLNIARDGGKPKNVGTAPISHGMKRQTHGTPSAFHHGVTVQDEPNSVKAALTAKTVPVHFGMPTHMNSAHERGWAPQPGDASRHLRASSRLSARDAQKSKDEGFDHSFVGARLGKQQLPASKRKLSE